MPWGQGGGGGGGGWGWGSGDGGGGVTNIIHAVISGITEVVAGGVLRADKATYDDTTAGWWLGRDPDDAVSKLHFGDAAQYLRWTGSALELAGSIGGFITDLVIATAGAIRSGKASYDDTTAGWWIGYDDAMEPSAPRISVGDATYYLKWTGTALEIVGAIGGAITDLVMATNGAIRSGKTGPTDTTPGWWIGEQFGTPKFNLGDDEDAIAWNGSYLSILGRIGGEISELVVSSLLGGVFRSGKTSFSDFVNSGWWIGWDDGSPALNIGNDEAFLTFHPDQIPPVQYKWTGAYIDPATLPGSALEDGAVTSSKIGASAVTATAIADEAVTGDKIETSAVVAKHLGTGAVGSTALASGAVTSSKIASGAVTALALATGAVGSSALASNAVTSGKIASAAVTADKLSVAALEDVATNTGDLNVSGTLTVTGASANLIGNDGVDDVWELDGSGLTIYTPDEEGKLIKFKDDSDVLLGVIGIGYDSGDTKVYGDVRVSPPATSWDTYFRLASSAYDSGVQALSAALLLDTPYNALPRILQSVGSQETADNAEFQFYHYTYGATATPGAGFGLLLRLMAEDSTTPSMDLGAIKAGWDVATHASRAASVEIQAADSTGQRTGVKVSADGSQVKLGLLGATPVARQSHIADPSGGGTIDTQARTAINSILDALEAFGLLATS